MIPSGAEEPTQQPADNAAPAAPAPAEPPGSPAEPEATATVVDTPASSSKTGRRQMADVGRVGLGVARRRRGWLIVITIAASLLSCVAGLVWNWLLPPTGGLVDAGRFTVGMWVALVAAGATIVVLSDRKPRRRITLLSLLAVALTVLCCLPAGWFWTFAVSHGVEGADCTGCAVLDYFGSGPFGYELVTDTWKFDHLLCAERRPQLRRQAEQIRHTMDSVLADVTTGYYQAEPGDTVKTEVDHGDQATVSPHVYLVYMWRDADNQLQRLPVDAGSWTFHLVHRDGWQICQVDTPDICHDVVICDPAQRQPAPSASPSPSDSAPWYVVPWCSSKDPFRVYHHCDTPSPGTQDTGTPAPTPAPSGSQPSPSLS